MNQYIEPKQNSPDNFYSHDLGLVACLLCLGYELIDMDKSMPNKIEFIIGKKRGIEKAIKDYWNFDTTIDAQTYFNNLKRLKNQIFSSK